MQCFGANSHHDLTTVCISDYFLISSEPHYGGFQHQLASELIPGAEEPQHSSKDQDSSELYSRIQDLSEKIRTVRMELGKLEDRESVESGLGEEGPPFYSEGDDEESVNMSSRTYTGGDDCSSAFALVPVEDSTTTEMQESQDSHACATKITSPLNLSPTGQTRTKTSEIHNHYSSLDSSTADKDGISVLQQPSSESPSHSSHSGASEEESHGAKRHPPQVDLKLQRAIEKMKKLDTKLADLTKARSNKANLLTSLGKYCSTSCRKRKR